MRSTGRLTKSDSIDAQMLAVFGERMKPAPTEPPNALRLPLEQRVKRRHQLVELQTTQKNHREHSDDKQVVASIERVERVLVNEIKKLDAAITKLVEEDAELRDKSRRMQTVRGVGPAVSSGLLAHMPGLGDQAFALVETNRLDPDASGLGNLPNGEGFHDLLRHLKTVCTLYRTTGSRDNR